MQLHHEEHEDSEGNPGNATLRSGFMDFAVPADARFSHRQLLTS